MITRQPALALPPQTRPDPTARALSAENTQGGVPIGRGPIGCRLTNSANEIPQQPLFRGCGMGAGDRIEFFWLCPRRHAKAKGRSARRTCRLRSYFFLATIRHQEGEIIYLNQCVAAGGALAARDPMLFLQPPREKRWESRDVGKIHSAGNESSLRTSDPS